MRCTFLSVGFFSILLLVVGCQSEPAAVATNVIMIVETQNQPVSPAAAVETATLEPPAQRDEDGLLTRADSTPTENGEEAVQEQADADVTFVRAVRGSDSTWTFHVTVSHPDKGWDDYADGWDVLLADGTVLKKTPSDPFTRLLLHPHENEQPFTRSQSGLVIPEGINSVTVRAHDILDGYGGREVELDLSLSSGPDFDVEKP